MKTSRLLFAAFVATLGLVACETPNPQQPTDEPKTFTVKLGVKGEISVSQNPLTRFTPDSRDLYGIQVYHKPASETGYVPYAYGLFDNIDDVTLEVTENYNYNFEVILVDDGKDKIFHDSILVDNVPYIGYDYPFYAQNKYSGASTNSMTKVSNEFTYAEDKYFKGNGNKGFSTSYYKDLDGRVSFTAPNIDSYYGELEAYTPTEEDTTVDIYLKHMVFGLKVQAGEFLTEGSVKVKFYYSGSAFYPFTITPDNKSIEITFAYGYGLSDWYAKTDVTKATTTNRIDFVWTKADDTTVDWQEALFTFTRLKQTVVNLDYYEDSTIGSNKITMHYDDTEMEKDYKSYIIGDTQDEYDW